MPSTISAGTSAGTALNLTSDTTGNLAFQTNNGVTALSIDTNQNVTFANNVTYTGNIQGATITATAAFSGNGATISAINASNVTSGTLASARLPTSGVNASSITAGTLAVAQGGTGSTSLTANNVLLGNGTSALQAVAPGSNGNILTSNGTTWVSQAPAGGGVTSLNGQTGAITNTSSGAIGAYASAYLINGGGVTTLVGATVAGSSLRLWNSSVANGGGIASTQNSTGTTSAYKNPSYAGTWRAMGDNRNGNTDKSGNYQMYMNLYVRVS